MNFSIGATVNCQNCGLVFSRHIDTLKHFVEISMRRGWKRVTFIKPDDTGSLFTDLSSLPKDISGQFVCPKCLKAIDEFWDKYKEKKEKHIKDMEEKEAEMHKLYTEAKELYHKIKDLPDTVKGKENELAKVTQGMDMQKRLYDEAVSARKDAVAIYAAMVKFALAK
jgi:transcription-repair coupling factor (superfamily II helicase)